MSAILSNVMNNAIFAEGLDAVILMSTMCLGWFLFSFVGGLVMKRHRYHHLRTKLACAETDLPEICAGPSTRSVDFIEDGACADDAQKVHCLLESYGAFGASPGTWVRATAFELDATSEISEEAADEHEGVESDEERQATPQEAARTKSDLGRLFEHYSLFHSDLGTWCAVRGEHSDEASEESTEDVRSTPGTADETAASIEGGRVDAVKALFEQYSLFGAEPGTWGKDSDCSTVYSSESEAGDVMDDLASHIESDDEVGSTDSSEDLFEQLIFA